MPDYENDYDGGWDRHVENQLAIAEAKIGADGVHYFLDAHSGYDATQCDERIKDGDVLVVESAGIVGILYDVAWPVALTEAGAAEWGAFRDDARPDERYAGQIEKAVALATDKGFALQERFR